MEKTTLVAQLKAQIIEALLLEDLTPDDIDPAAPLFVDGLGLDSIDALELILLLNQHYGIKIEDPKERRDVLQSVNTMADCILNHQKSEG
ncbi:MAG: phosphopantetheine-binding protein [Prevotellaceae bacterium]|jgi:acyl carrier protein|nr:phosphopantetheine-binding protein [Prevotellaceae bacterium]